tara:strand:- start:175 stop:513 length:339 start_codon:yes stop_codon:yes gene_type:complete
MRKHTVRSKYINSKSHSKKHFTDDALTPHDILKKLGFVNLATNLESSLIAWYRAGYPIVTSTDWDYRINICRKCKYWKELSKSKIATCEKCGCSSGKLLLKTSKCPLKPPKW